MEILPFLLAPFLASLILTGIHAYLGVHVVERGVIFVDLALAQIAALGATIAILIGMDPHGSGAYWLSLAFTFVGAAIFAFARTRRGHIPQEAFIGIAYAVASATAILAMSKATGETEHLKDMLVGNILAVSMREVVKTAILYGGIGVFHYIFPVLRVVRFCCDLFRCDCWRSPGLLLSRGPFRRCDALCGQNWAAPRHRMDHGHASLRVGSVLLGLARHAHGCDDRLHLWRGFDLDVLRLFALCTAQKVSCTWATILSRRVERPSPRQSSINCFPQAVNLWSPHCELQDYELFTVSSPIQCLPRYTAQVKHAHQKPAPQLELPFGRRRAF